MSARFGRYTLDGKLATGGMAEVFLARLTVDGGFERKVVIKRVLPQYATNADFLTLFQQEARFASFLTHPNIAQVSDFGVDADGTAFLVMEYVDGASLRELIKASAARGERPDSRLVCRLFSQVADALGAVHAAADPATRAPLELVHRDVSPENVLLSRQGAVKLADFGIARATSQVSTTSPDVIRGKLRYLAPEQVLGEPLSPAIDVWALGVTLYEALALARPFPEDNEGQTVNAIVTGLIRPLEEVRPDLPPQLLAVVRRCLAREPSQRYPDCHDLAHDLEQIATAGAGSVTAKMLGNWVERLVPTTVVTPLPRVEQPAAFGAPGSHALDLDPEPQASVTAEHPRHALAPDEGATLATHRQSPASSAPQLATTRAHAPAAEPRPQLARRDAPAAETDEAAPQLSRSDLATRPHARGDVVTHAPSAEAPQHAQRATPDAPAPAAEPSEELARRGVTTRPHAAAEPDEAAPSRSRRGLLVGLLLVGGALTAAWFARHRAPAQRQVVLTSVPSGATVRYGAVVLGQTPWAGDLPRDVPVELEFSAPGLKSVRRVLPPGALSLEVKLPR